MEVYIIIAVIAVLFLLLLLGFPVGFSLLGAGMVGILMFRMPLSSVIHVAYQVVDNFVLVAVPGFIFMSEILLQSEIAEDLFDIANMFLRKIKGGLAVSTIVTCGFFAAITGSSTANAATVGLVSIPALIKRKYEKNFVYGTVAAGGTLGILIPPSIPLIIYGNVTDVSVGKLFIAGVFPGILGVTLFSLYALYKSRTMKGLESQAEEVQKFSYKKLLSGTWALMLPVIIMTMIYTGVCTPTEASGVAVLYSVFLGTCIYRKLTLKSLISCVLKTVKTTTMIFSIVIGAMTFGYVMAILQLPQALCAFIVEYKISTLEFIGIINVICVFLGMFLDPVSIIMLIMPILTPTLVTLKIDFIWFAIILTVNMELANLTPPVGLNLYVVKGIANCSLEDVIKGGISYIILLAVLLVIIIAFPFLSTWLPQFTV